MNQTDATGPVSITSLAGMTRSGSGSQFLDGTHCFAKYVWITKGSGRCMIEGVSQSFGPHTLIYIPKDTPHHFHLPASVYGTVISLHNQTDVFLPEKLVFLPLRNINIQNQANTCIDMIVREFNTQEDCKIEALSCLVGLLTIFVTRQSGNTQAKLKTNHSQKLMKQFSYLLERDFLKSRPLKDYAAELRVTPTHLSRVCNKVNGVSASQLIQNRVLNEAKTRLRNSNKKINMIATELGFTSAAYFTRFFANRQGKTPKEFRNISVKA